MTLKPLSESQLRTLNEVSKNRVIYETDKQRYRSARFPPAVRSDVVKRLRDAGLIEVKVSQLGRMYAAVELTDAARTRLMAGA
jgi:hypothetical protein